MHPRIFAEQTPDKPALIMEDTGEVITFADLEARARANPGGAVGFARPYPATLLRLGPWIGSLAGKGITLVPVSALARERP